jgi:hypothetical protein
MSPRIGGDRWFLRANAKMIQVRYRSRATYSRQPRQVRKEATVTGSCVCSESPVPDLIFFPQQPPKVPQPLISRFYILLLLFSQEMPFRAIYRSEKLRSTRRPRRIYGTSQYFP